MKYLVYTLREPDTSTVRYIGKSCSGLIRPVQHIQPSRLKEISRKNSWIKSLLKKGQTPNEIGYC